MSVWILPLAMAAVVLAVVLLALAVYLAFNQVRKPSRAWLDPVPLAWRSLWPLVEAIAFWVKPALSEKLQTLLANRLQRAGWQFWINPHQFVGLCVVSAVLAAVVAWLLAGVWMEAALDAVLGAGLLGFFLPLNFIAEKGRNRRLQTLRQLPFFIDLMVLGVESGQPLSAAISLSVQHGVPGPLRDEFQRLQRDIRAGKTRRAALESMAERMDQVEISNLVSTLTLAEQQGMQLGTLLRAQADTRRNERFIRAEKLAMQAPVKMLFPLIVFVFPGTFAIILFPIALQLMSSGGLF